MSNTMHTPGPWRRGKVNRRRIYADGDNSYVADSRTEANARLIAAAPDLLSALTEVLTRLEQVDPLPDGGTSSLRDNARAAIAAVKGEK